MHDKQHLWTCDADFSKVKLDSSNEVLPYYTALTQLQLDYNWPIVRGIAGICMSRYEIEFEMGLFFRTKDDVLRIIAQLSKVMELGEPNITGLEKIPSILDGMTVSAATADKCELPKLPELAAKNS